MNINFKISEFNISGRPIPEKIADKILEYHIVPMQAVRDELQIAIWPSEKSGYRSKAWELSKGRSGTSQHTFQNKGAVDWTCENFTQNKKDLLQSIIDNTEYTRMAIYNSFIHCDYAATNTNKRQIFTSTPDSKWVFLTHAEDYNDTSI